MYTNHVLLLVDVKLIIYDNHILCLLDGCFEMVNTIFNCFNTTLGFIVPAFVNHDTTVGVFG